MHPLLLLSYLLFIAREVIAGSVRVALAALGSSSRITPAIIEFPLRCATDIEITVMASSITITPGTLVVGVAAADGDTPPTLFVHSMFDDDRASVVAGLRDMETRLLRMTRGADGERRTPAAPGEEEVSA